jgi:undecaprenyl phosphate-alpha-L-ara4N flippase subunit ArnE
MNIQSPHILNATLIGASVMTQVSATSLIKMGAVRTMGAQHASTGDMIWAWLNLYFLMGIAVLVVQMVMWTLVLRRVELSRAYPFMALVLPLNLGVAALVFNEAIAWNHVLGVALIGAGLVCVSRRSDS